MTEPSQPRPGPGTTVIARNLFYNLPVRKKSLNEGLELEKIRFRVAGLALMWPLISFSLRDDITGNVVLQTHKCSGILATFSSLFGGARAKHMREVETQNDIFKVTGYVSRENYSRKDLQFVFVNRRLVLKSKVHKMLNAVLSKSVLVRRRGNASYKSSKQAGQERSPFAEGGSPIKLFERYAVYVINIDCPLSAYDITFDPAKTLVEFHDWPELTRLIETMLLKFLQDENLLLPSEEGQVAQEPGVSAAAAVLDEESASHAPDVMCETDDPFAGADDAFDVEFHADLQRKQYTQGISTHNSLNTLFSRTVRRPFEPPEEEGFGNLDPSPPKKSRPDSNASDVADQNQKTPPKNLQAPTRHSKAGISDDNVRSFVTAAGTCPVNTSAAGPQRTGKLAAKQAYLTDGEGLRSDNGYNFKETSPAHVDRGAAESMDNEDAEITLPQAVRPLKRVIPPASHQQVLSEGLSDQASSSGSASKIKEICLPRHFAHSSSLSRLRARLARELTPSLSSSSSSGLKTPGGASATSSLHTFERTQQQSNNRPKALKETLHLEEGLDVKPAEIVLPLVKRPPLFRSRSLDADCSFCRGNMGCFKHKMSDISRASHKADIRMSDDTDISYASNRMSDLKRKKHGPEKSNLIAINPQHLSSRTGVPADGSAMQNGPNGSLKSHFPSEFSCRAHTVYSDEAISSDVNARTLHRHPIPTNGKEDAAPPTKQQVLHVKDINTAKVTRDEIQRSGSSASRPVDHSQSTSKLSHANRTKAPRPGDPSNSARPSNICPSVSKGSGQSVSCSSDLGASTSELRTLSQASKLARLMRREGVPSSCGDTGGCGEAGVNKNASFHDADCSHFETNETTLPQRQQLASRSRHAVTQMPEAFYMQGDQGRAQGTYKWHDLNALGKLANTRSARSSSSQRCSKSTESEEPREKRFSQFSLFETPQTALQANSKGEQGKDVHEADELDTQHLTERRVHHQSTAALNFFETSCTEGSLSTALTGNENDTASKVPGDGTNQQKDLRSRRTADSVSISQRPVPFSLQELAGQHEAQENRSKMPAQSVRDQVSSSGDGPVSQAMQFSKEQALSTQGFPGVCAASGEPLSVAQNSIGRCQGEELAQHNTQGFAAVTSQGFVAQISEEGTMPFEVDTGVTCETPSHIHDDSPMSARSLGFSPAVADPLLADPEARNSTSPDRADSDFKNSSPVVGHPDAKNTTSFDVGHPDAKHTTSPVMADPNAEIISTNRATGNCDIQNAAGVVVVQEKTTQSQSSVLCCVSTNDLTKLKSQVQADVDTKEDSCRMTNETESSVSMCEQNSCQLPIRSDAGLNGMLSSQEIRMCSNSDQSVPASQKSAAGDQSHIPQGYRVVSDKEADNLEEEMTLTDSSEIPCGQRVVRSLVVSSMASSSSVASSCGSDSQFSESVMGTWPAVADRPSVENLHDAESKANGQNGKHLYRGHRFEHGGESKQKSRLGTEKDQENSCHEEGTFASTSAERFVSGAEPIVSPNSESPSISNRTRHQAKRKMAVERTYNLSFLSGKKPRSIISSGSSRTAASKDEIRASLSVNSQAGDERTLPEKQPEETLLPSSDFEAEERDVCLFQQSDSFSDSVPDSALATVAMPGNAAAAADREMSTPISLPDRALASVAVPENALTAAKRETSTPVSLPGDTLAGVVMPENSPTATAADKEIDTPISLPYSTLADATMPGNASTATDREIGIPDSLPDCALTSIATTQNYVSTTTAKDAEMASSTPNSVPDTLANVEMPETPATAQTTPVDAAQAAFGTPSSVPDSVIIKALAPENEPAASPLPDFQVGACAAGQAVSDFFTQATPAASVQTIASDAFTQNAYHLGSALSTTPSNRVAGEGPNSSNSVSQSMFPRMAPNSIKGCVGEEFVSEQPCCSHDSSTVDGGSSTRRDVEDVREAGERGREGGTGKSSKEVVWIPVTDPSTGMYW